ncbi:ubiquitin carboxyl-terminal hydrolase 24 isoform X2 [Euphorbia lathyris]|uniref:ubiquitin carboxyl-terminal hydrolase 24 isoform X2 n=1 Tax=Euphorbia lathyris TaxID=212925 RepID=UPI0033136C87
MSKKVVVFGSFTEDETKSLLKKHSSEKGEKPLEKKGLQFGSLDNASGFTFGDFNVKSSRQPSLANGKVSFETANSLKKEKDVNCAKPADHMPAELRSAKQNGTITNIAHGISHSNGLQDFKANSPKKEKDVNCAKKADHMPAELRSAKQNGTIDNIAHGSSHSNGIKDFKAESVDLTSLHLTQNGDNSSNQSRSSKFHVLDFAVTKDSNSEETNNVWLVPLKKEDTRKPADGGAAAVRSILPRGLINSGNLCFLNATLQALLSCSPFVQLLQDLKTRNIPRVGFPTLTAFSQFISDLDMPSSSSLKKDMAVLETGRPFSPAMFEGVLKFFTPDVPSSMSGRPRQEDAQEFLSFIMDQMHHELLKLEGQSGFVNGIKSSLVSSTEDDEWETVGPKNKSAVTRTQSFIPSELSDIFGGQLRSVVRARGNTDSATIQPYLLLHLDIYPEAVSTIEDALHLFAAPENLEGYRAAKTGKAGVVAARKSLKIQTLSKIMILHLMRFSYGSQGSTKLHKPVHFPLELVLGRELLYSPSTASRKYELVATITHHGREPSKGHYTADARYSNRQWLRFDDASVTKIGTNKVLHDQAYVLFYKQV